MSFSTESLSTVFLQVPVLRGYTQEVPAGKAADLHDTLNVLDGYLSNGKWVAADHYTIADFHALPTVTNVQVSDCKLMFFISQKV